MRRSILSQRTGTDAASLREKLTFEELTQDIIHFEDMLDLFIVIPTHNRKNSVINLLNALQDQDIKSIRNIRITTIVVNDGSTDGTTSHIRTFYPHVHILEGDGHWWWTKSVNEGCKFALKHQDSQKQQAVLLLNDDIHLHPQYLQQLLTAHLQHPTAIIGSLNLTYEENPRIFFSGAQRMAWWNGKLEKYHPFLTPYQLKGRESTSISGTSFTTLTGIRSTVVLPGRGLLIPFFVFSTNGYFDEKALPQYKADYDFVLRAHKKGIPTLISWDAIIYNQVETTGSGSTFKKQGLSTFVKSLFQPHSRTNLYRNLIYYKRHYPIGALLLLPLTALLILFRQLIQFFREKKY